MSIPLESSLLTFRDRVSDALRGETIKEWDEIDKKVQDIVDAKHGGRFREAEFD